MNECDLIDYLQAFLAPAIGLLAIVIGVLQWRINAARLRYDLFDKKFAVFDAARTYISRTLAHGRPPQDEQRLFLERTAGSQFLFSQDVANYLTKIWDKTGDLECSVAESRDLEPGEDKSQHIHTQREIKDWLLEQSQSIDEHFSDYLIVEKRWGRCKRGS